MVDQSLEVKNKEIKAMEEAVSMIINGKIADLKSVSMFKVLESMNALLNVEKQQKTNTIAHREKHEVRLEQIANARQEAIKEKLSQLKEIVNQYLASEQGAKFLGFHVYNANEAGISQDIVNQVGKYLVMNPEFVVEVLQQNKNTAKVITDSKKLNEATNIVVDLKALESGIKSISELNIETMANESTYNTIVDVICNKIKTKSLVEVMSASTQEEKQEILQGQAEKIEQAIKKFEKMRLTAQTRLENNKPYMVPGVDC